MEGMRGIDDFHSACGVKLQIRTGGIVLIARSWPVRRFGA
jgi:hypothetical protein